MTENLNITDYKNTIDITMESLEHNITMDGNNKEIVNLQNRDFMLNSNEIAFWLVSYPDLKLLYVSNGSSFVYFHEPQDFYLNPELWHKIQKEDDYIAFMHALKVAEEYGIATVERTVYNEHGVSHKIKDFINIIRDKDGNPERFQGIAVKIKSDNEIIDETNAERLSFLLGNIKEIIFQTDIDGNWVYLNPAWEDVTGFKINKCLGKNYLDFVHEDCRRELKKNLQKLISGEKSNHRQQLKYIHKNQKDVYVDIYVELLKIPAGKFVGTTGIIRDITEKINSDNDFKKLQTRNQALLNSIPDLFLILNRDGKIEDFNISDKSGLRFNPSEYIGKYVSEVLPEYVSSDFKDKLNKSILKDCLYSFEYESQDSSGIHYYEARISKLSDNQAIALIRNITKQKIAEKKLEYLNSLNLLISEISNNLIQSNHLSIHSAISNSLAKLGTLTNVDRVYIFDFDFEQGVCNNTFEWCSQGISPEIENLQGVPTDLVPRWMFKFFNREYVYIPSVPDIDDEYSAEKEILEPQGIKSLVASPMFYGNNLIGFIGFDSVKVFKEWEPEAINLLKLAGDIIAGSIYRHKFEEELILQKQIADDANRSKSEFLANMSHEIRTPMNAILGFSEVLLGQDLPTKEKKYASTIYKSAKSLLSLINDILDLSKIEAGALEIVKEPMSVKILFNEIKQIFSQKLSEKELYLNLQLQDGFPDVIEFDDVRFRQVLFNLVGNAIKFTEKGGITLKGDITYGLGNGIVDMKFSVIDTGIGIDKSNHELIFESFRQLEKHSVRKYEGTGLGLAITKKLVDALGGTISVESEPGVGSIFVIEFRKIKVSNQKIDIFEESSIIDSLEFSPANILVVDDVEPNRELVKSYLSKYNFMINEAANGIEALDLINSTQFDVVLMDIRMPEMDGYEAAQVIKQNSSRKQPPIIAFTASTMQSEEARVKALFDDYLTKPVSRYDLINIICKFVPHRQSETNQNLLIMSESDINVIVARNLVDSIQRDILLSYINEFDNKLKAGFFEILDYFDLDTINELLQSFDKLSDSFGIESYSDITTQMRDASSNYDIDMLKECTITIIRSMEYCKKIIN